MCKSASDCLVPVKLERSPFGEVVASTKEASHTHRSPKRVPIPTTKTNMHVQRLCTQSGYLERLLLVVGYLPAHAKDTRQMPVVQSTLNVRGVTLPLLSLVDTRTARNARPIRWCFLQGFEHILYGPDAHGSANSLLARLSMSASTWMLNRSVVEHKLMSDELYTEIMDAFKQLRPAESRGRVRNATLLPLTVAIAAATAYGRCDRTVALLQGLAAVPHRWELEIEQAVAQPCTTAARSKPVSRAVRVLCRRPTLRREWPTCCSTSSSRRRRQRNARAAQRARRNALRLCQRRSHHTPRACRWTRGSSSPSPQSW